MGTSSYVIDNCALKLIIYLEFDFTSSKEDGRGPMLKKLGLQELDQVCLLCIACVFTCCACVSLYAQFCAYN